MAGYNTRLIDELMEIYHFSPSPLKLDGISRPNGSSTKPSACLLRQYIWYYTRCDANQIRVSLNSISIFRLEAARAQAREAGDCEVERDGYCESVRMT